MTQEQQEELQHWCLKHGMAINVFEEVFKGLNVPPDWVYEVYNMGAKSKDQQILGLQTQIEALKLTLNNLGTHLHLETKKRWWQRK